MCTESIHLQVRECTSSLLKLCTLIGPHRSIWIVSNGLSQVVSTLGLCEIFFILPCSQVRQRVSLLILSLSSPTAKNSDATYADATTNCPPWKLLKVGRLSQWRWVPWNSKYINSQAVYMMNVSTVFVFHRASSEKLCYQIPPVTELGWAEKVAAQPCNISAVLNCYITIW